MCIQAIASSATTFTTGQTFVASSTDGSFSHPTGIAVDSVNGFYYVADDARIQKFNLSTGAFVGAIGNSTASGTCVAGKQSTWCTGGSFSSTNGDGTFSSPTSIGIDSTNNGLYVFNGVNVEKFLLTTGAFVGSIGKVSTASGSCVLGKQSTWCTGGSLVRFAASSGDGAFSNLSSYPGSLAVDTTNNNLYVADPSNNRIEKFVLTTGAFVGSIGQASSSTGTCTVGIQSSWCTGGIFATSPAQGGFAYPFGLAADPANNYLYILGGRMDRFVLSTGVYSASIGNSTASGTCVNGKQNAWCTGGNFSSGTGDGMFNQILYGAYVDSANNYFYVNDGVRIEKFVTSTGAFVGAIGNSTASGTCVNGKQNGWCTGGNFSGGTSDGMFGNTYGYGGIAFDSSGNMYVADYANNRVQKFTASATVVGSAGATVSIVSPWNSNTSGAVGTSLDGGFNSPIDVALDTTNNFMYVVDYGNYRIQKFVLSTGAFVGAIGNSTASGTCVNGKQNAWCTGGNFSSGTTDGMFVGPTGIAIDVANNSMFILDNAAYRIQKFVLSTGAFVGAIGNSTASGTCVNGKQNGWCTGGNFSGGTGDGMLLSSSTLSKIAGDFTNGNLYITGGNGRVQKFTSSTGAFVGAIGNSTASGTCVAGKQSTWCTGGSFSSTTGDGTFYYPAGINVDPVKNYLYVTDYQNLNVQKFVLSTGAFVGAIGKSTASGTCVAGSQNAWCTGGNFVFGSAYGGAFEQPDGIGIDTVNDRMYVSDTQYHSVQKFVLSTGAFVLTITGFANTVVVDPVNNFMYTTATTIGIQTTNQILRITPINTDAY